LPDNETYKSTEVDDPLTKADLIADLFPKIGTTQKEAAGIVDIIFGSMVRALRTGDKVEIRGFGSFRTRPRRARIGRNPKTGARVKVPAKRIPFFKPSGEVLTILNPPLLPSGARTPTGNESGG
jgi:integration host factor subunit beta